MTDDDLRRLFDEALSDDQLEAILPLVLGPILTGEIDAALVRDLSRNGSTLSRAGFVRHGCRVLLNSVMALEGPQEAKQPFDLLWATRH